MSLSADSDTAQKLRYRRFPIADIGIGTGLETRVIDIDFQKSNGFQCKVRMPPYLNTL